LLLREVAAVFVAFKHMQYYTKRNIKWETLSRSGSNFQSLFLARKVALL